MKRSETLWECVKCGCQQGKNDMWFKGDVCSECHIPKVSKADAKKIKAGYKKYRVTQWLRTYTEVEVWAMDEQEASDMACATKPKNYLKQLNVNAEPDGADDVEDITPK